MHDNSRALGVAGLARFTDCTEQYKLGYKNQPCWVPLVDMGLCGRSRVWAAQYTGCLLLLRVCVAG
jgi:hypothetical protein